MTTTSKRRILKTLFWIIFVIIGTIPFVDWVRKNKVYNEFIDIESSIYEAMPNENGGDIALYLSYCDTVIQYINCHPIELDFNIDCPDYSFGKDTMSNGNNFIKQVQIIDSKYRELGRRAKYLFFAVMIIGHILLALSKHFVDRKFKTVEKDAD